MTGVEEIMLNPVWRSIGRQWRTSKTHRKKTLKNVHSGSPLNAKTVLDVQKRHILAMFMLSGITRCKSNNGISIIASETFKLEME